MDVSRFLRPVAFSVTLLLGMQGAQALEPLPRDFSFGKYQRFKDFNPLLEQAQAGQCWPLLKEVYPRSLPPANLPGFETDEEWEKSVHLATRIDLAIEMFDRGLCVEFDPERAAELHLYRLERHIDYTLPVGWDDDLRLTWGWRVWNGFGVEADPDTALRVFENAMVRAKFDFDDPDYGRITWLGHRLPGPATELWDWIRDQVDTPEERIAYAVDLLDGGRIMPHGKPMRAAPDVMPMLLEHMYENAEAMYQIGIAAQAGLLGEEQGKRAERYLNNAAGCGHIDAIWKSVEFTFEDYERSPKDWVYDLLGWYWILDDLGYELLPEIIRIGEVEGVDYSQTALHVFISTRIYEEDRCDGRYFVNGVEKTY